MDKNLIEATSYYLDEADKKAAPKAVAAPAKKPVKKAPAPKAPAKKASLSLPKAEAYWISPTGKIFDVEYLHIVEILNSPEKFGLTRNEVEAVHKKHNEPYGSEGKARDEIMIDLIEDGWMRVRYIPKQDSWTVQLDARSIHQVPKEKIADFLMKLVIQNPKNKFSMVRIINLEAETLYFADIDEALDGEDSLTESKEIAPVLEVVDLKKVTYGYLIGESRLDYQIYHNSYTSAIEELRKYAEANGYQLDDDEMFNTIGSGPRKPSEGKTNKFTISLYKDGVQQRKALHAQIYGMGNKYELNMYIS